jgi:hypothetical protein
MRTFGIAEIADMSGLSISQIEQAISRERIDVRGNFSRRMPLPSALLVKYGAA